MNVRYRVELSQAERSELTAMLSKGKRAARKLKRAQIFGSSILRSRHWPRSTPISISTMLSQLARQL